MLNTNMMPHNPYYHSTPIHNPHLFFGRRNILRRVYALLASKQNIAITGLRRIGKSSLLICLAKTEFQTIFPEYDLSKHIFIFVDFEEHLQKSPEDFFAFVSLQLSQQTKDLLELEFPKKVGTTEFSQILTQINDFGFYPVLLFDEFDSVTSNERFDPNFFMFLRALANASKVSYVTASHAPLESLSHSNLIGSPFFNIFHFLQLGVLEKDEAISLITIPSQIEGHPFVGNDIDFILDVAGRHPFFIQRACYFLFENRFLPDVLGEVDYKTVKGQIYDQLGAHFEYTWKHLDADQQDKLINEARRETNNPRYYPELSESSLFRQFVRTKYNMTLDTLDITADDLEKVLEKIEDFHFLGRSKIIFLKSVHMQKSLDESNPPSVVEIGIVANKFLHLAVERLRPQGTFSHTALEWLPYNILNLCYFDKRLTNKQIASLLGISVRHFYRQRDEAIQKLLNVLLELEGAL